jgi:hypothetical protein
MVVSVYQVRRDLSQRTVIFLAYINFLLWEMVIINVDDIMYSSLFMFISLIYLIPFANKDEINKKKH